MHEVLVLLNRIRTLANLRAYAIAGGVVLLGSLILMGLGANIFLVQTLAAGVCFILTSLGIFIFLQHPVEWGEFLARKAALTVISMCAAIIRFSAYLIAALLSLLYFLFPFDIIPDVILLFGWIEDVAIAIGLFAGAHSARAIIPDISTDIQPIRDAPRLILSCALGGGITFLMFKLITTALT